MTELAAPIVPRVKLRPRDISALPADTTDEQATELLDRDYETFCTCVIAEAARWVPESIHRVLSKPEWHDDWVDALNGVEATLKVTVLRASYEHGPHSRKAIGNRRVLTAVRTRIAKVHASARHAEQADTQPRAADGPAVRLATKNLIRAHSEQYLRLITETLTAADIPTDLLEIPSDNCAVMARLALHLDPGIPIVPTPNSQVYRLAALQDDLFDQVVARDVQRDPEMPDLSHPLLLERWGDALGRLAELTAEHLGLPKVFISDVDMTVAGLDSDSAYRRINQLRFLAHVHQRWLEQKSRARRFRRDIVTWREDLAAPAYATARDNLRQMHADEYSDLLLKAKDADTKPAAIPVRRIPGPPTMQPSAAPQAALAFIDRMHQSGWDARLEQDQGQDRQSQVRVDATRGPTMLRVAYRRKGKGRHAGQGWTLVFVGAHVRGAAWVRFRRVAEAVDLAALPEDEFVQHIAEYRNDLPAERGKRHD